MDNSYDPVPTESLGAGRTAVEISAGWAHTCAILDNGLVSCWGANNDGQLGDGSGDDSSVPISTTLPSGRTVVAIAGGHTHNCVILDDGTVRCSGYGSDGVLGNNNPGSTHTTPTQTSSLGVGRTAVFNRLSR